MATVNEKIEVIAKLRHFCETQNPVMARLAELIGVTSDLASYIKGNNLPTSANYELIKNFTNLSLEAQQELYRVFVDNNKTTKKSFAEQLQELRGRIEKLERAVYSVQSGANNVHSIYTIETDTLAKVAGL